MRKLIAMGTAILAAAGLAAAENNRLEVVDGEIRRAGEPFFPLGFVFGWDDDALEQAKAVGMNSVHQEYSFMDLFPDGPEVSEAGLAHIREIHEAARRNDMVLFPLLTGHYIPHWLGSQCGPAPADVNGNPVGLWFPFSMYNPVYRETLKNFWTAVMNEVGGDADVGAFVLWNEPAYGLDATEHALAAYRAKIADEFGDIAAFNAAMNTGFTGFNAVVPPGGIEDNRAFFYHWMCYNQQAQADFFRWEAEVLKSIVPEVRVTSKHPLMSLGGDAFYCNDIVLQDEYQDIYGCDLYGGSLSHYRNSMEAARSLNRKGPVVTYETHAQKSLKQLQPQLSALQLFAQILGGCRGIFFFCAGDSVDGFSFFSDTATPPPVRAEFTRLFRLIDANQEYFAAPRRAAKIAVVLSNPSTVHYGGVADSSRRADYTSRVAQTYDMIRNQHFAVDFISDRQFADKLGEYELIVLPSKTILSQENLDRLAQFHRGGGRILAFGEALARGEDFQEIPPPGFLGFTERKASPWNRSDMRLTEVAPELGNAFRAELIVQRPEIVNPAPLEQIIPGYEAKISNESAAWLAGNQDAYPSIIQSSDEQVVYCAFDSQYSEGLSALLGEIIERKLGIDREVEVTVPGVRGQAIEVMTAVSDAGDTPVLMLANTSPAAGSWQVRVADADRTAWRDIATDRVYNVADGLFSVALPGYGYMVLAAE